MGWWHLAHHGVIASPILGPKKNRLHRTTFCHVPCQGARLLQHVIRLSATDTLYQHALLKGKFSLLISFYDSLVFHTSDCHAQSRDQPLWRRSIPRSPAAAAWLACAWIAHQELISGHLKLHQALAAGAIPQPQPDGSPVPTGQRMVSSSQLHSAAQPPPPRPDGGRVDAVPGHLSGARAAGWPDERPDAGPHEHECA